jgi:hypothetical protein
VDLRGWVIRLPPVVGSERPPPGLDLDQALGSQLGEYPADRAPGGPVVLSQVGVGRQLTSRWPLALGQAASEVGGDPPSRRLTGAVRGHVITVAGKIPLPGPDTRRSTRHFYHH